MIPLLIKPHWQALKNRWTGDIDLRRQSGRDVILFIFSALVVAAIYRGTLWALVRINENPTLAYLPPGHFLALILVFLIIMLTITSVLSAVGSLFMAEDLNLILAAPVSTFKLFSGKFLGICALSGWMPFLFIIPLLAAFGRAYQSGAGFYAAAILALIPFFVIPAAVGMIAGILLVLIIPVYRVREMLFVVFIALLAAVYFVIDALSLEWTALRSAQEMMRIISILSMPGVEWLPSNWVASILQEILRSSGAPWRLYLVLLYLSAAALTALAFLCLQVFHFPAFSRAGNKAHGAKVDSRRAQAWLRRIGSFWDPKFRALLGKEMRVLSRDLGQAVQVIMLLSISLIYLYHLRVFSAVESFPESIRPWWKSFLFAGNICMGAFITTAFCARFVYPSISLEGRSYWVLQSAPLAIGEMMRAKFLSWFVPVALIGSVFFASGAFAIGAPRSTIVLSAVLSVIMCYGLVGMAVGIGAVFAQFDWEHSSQLAAGFGSFIFMLCAIFLIFLSMVPAAVMLLAGDRTELPAGLHAITASCTALAIAINFLAARLALDKGAKSLAKEMEK